MPSFRVPMTSLATDQSQYARGPFQRLHNLCMREPEMIEPLPGAETVANNIGPVGYTARRMWGVKEQATAYEIALLRSAGSGYALRAVLGSGSAAPALASASLLGMPCGLTEARQRPIYAGPRGALVFEDDMDSARMLGMLQPTFIAVESSTTSDAQAIPTNSRAAWRATLHRKHSDGYEIASAPSYAIYGEDPGAGTRDYTIRVGWVEVGLDSDQRVREGDILRLWRTRSVLYQTATNDRFLLTSEIILEAGHISNRYIDIRDVTPDAALASREELYTNPGMQGALSANWQLGPCGDVETYAQHAFYVQRSLPVFFKTSISSYVGSLASGIAQRTYGIGIRGITGDTTITSPIITNVSDTTGIVPGQVLTASVGANFPVGTRVIGVGVTDITMSVGASATTVSDVMTFTDVLEISTDGGGSTTRLWFTNLLKLLYDIWDNNVPLITTVNDVVNGEDVVLSTGAPISIAFISGGLTLRFDMIAPYGSAATDLEVAASNGQNYSPQIAEAFDGEVSLGDIDERLNRLQWAKLDQPEHVPAANELVVGKAEIVRTISTQDRLYAFCTDGAHAVTGRSGTWTVDDVDRDLEIANQAAADVMKGNVYVYAKRRGLLRISPSGAVEGLTKGAIQRELDALYAGLTSETSPEVHVVCDELHDEVGVFMRAAGGGESVDVAELCHVFNERTACWRTQTPGVTVAGPSALEAWCWSARRESVVWSQGGSGAGAADIRANDADTDLTEPIPGADLQTYPLIPDGSTTGMRRYHEALLTLSTVEDIAASALDFSVSTGMTASTSVVSNPKPLPGNPTAASTDAPAFYQLRHMVGRATHIGPSLVINFVPDAATTGRWRLHAIEVLWEPCSARSYAR